MIVQPTLAEGLCHFLRLVSFMAMAQQTGGIAIKSQMFLQKWPGRYFHMPVPSPPAAYYHDILLTERWAIVVDSSLRRDSSRLLSGKSTTFFNSSYNMRSFLGYKYIK